MNKMRALCVCLTIPLLILTLTTVWKIKKHREYQQKVELAKETRKVLEHLMVDLSQVTQGSVLYVPADGMWHNRLAFVKKGQGAFEYVISEGHLFRTNNGKVLLIADDIVDLKARRQMESPDLLEIQIEAQNNFTLNSNLKIRVSH